MPAQPAKRRRGENGKLSRASSPAPSDAEDLQHTSRPAAKNAMYILDPEFQIPTSISDLLVLAATRDPVIGRELHELSRRRHQQHQQPQHQHQHQLRHRHPTAQLRPNVTPRPRSSLPSKSVDLLRLPPADPAAGDPVVLRDLQQQLEDISHKVTWIKDRGEERHRAMMAHVNMVREDVEETVSGMNKQVNVSMVVNGQAMQEAVIS